MSSTETVYSHLATPYGQFYVAPWPSGVWSIPDRELSLGAKAVWSLLASYAGVDGRCFPSQDRMASDLGQTRRKVQLAIWELEAFGLIGVVERPGRSHAYVFPMHPALEISLRAGGSDGECSAGRMKGEAGVVEIPVEKKAGFPQPAPPGGATPAPPGGARSRSSSSSKKKQKPVIAEDGPKQLAFAFALAEVAEMPLPADEPKPAAEPSGKHDRPTDRPASGPAPREAAAAPMEGRASPGPPLGAIDMATRPRFVPSRGDVEQLAAFMASHTGVYDLRFAYRVFENSRRLTTLKQLTDRCSDRIKRGFKPEGNGWFLAVAVEKWGDKNPIPSKGLVSAGDLLAAAKARERALDYAEFQRQFEAELLRRGP